MTRTLDQLREQETKRQRENEWLKDPANPPTWAPTLTKEEKEQREKDIAAGVIPF